MTDSNVNLCFYGGLHGMVVISVEGVSLYLVVVAILFITWPKESQGCV